jgi:cytochrome c oxidase subunit 2
VTIAADTIRDEFTKIFDVYWAIGVGVFVLICVLLVAFLFLFREGRHKGTSQRHGNMPLELSYAAFIACVVAFLVWLTFTTMDSGGYRATAQGGQPAHVPADALRIDVTASRWNWRFDYPRQGVIVQGGPDDTPTLTVPQNRPVLLRMRSLDVIHGIWIPQLRFKQDIFPGFTNTMTLTFPDAGVLRDGGECAQFCGLHHADMVFDIRVLPAGAFARWAAREGR